MVFGECFKSFGFSSAPLKLTCVCIQYVRQAGGALFSNDCYQFGAKASRNDSDSLPKEILWFYGSWPVEIACPFSAQSYRVLERQCCLTPRPLGNI